MTLTFELWHLLTLALTLGGMFTGLGKLLLMQFERRIEERFGAVTVDAAAWREVEKGLLQLRVELPERYLRREDYIRGQTTIEAKLDAIANELKLVQIQGAKRAN